MRKFYYYKNLNGDWFFQDGLTFTDDWEALKHLVEKRKAGFMVWRLYPDIPEDMEIIGKF